MFKNFFSSAVEEDIRIGTLKTEIKYLKKRVLDLENPYLFEINDIVGEYIIVSRNKTNFFSTLEGEKIIIFYDVLDLSLHRSKRMTQKELLYYEQTRD